MRDESTEFYLYGLDGQVLLVEISEFDGGVSVTIADRRLDLESESAFELADALIQIANSVEENSEI
jgi:ubiquinone biosynthesis protein UbiJ|tara:strand:- start:307 stop:504 length:198 start_codon:yes stop_codon:yes gene_type:complete